MVLPKLLYSYKDVEIPTWWRARAGIGNWIAICRNCKREYIDDFPVGSLVLKSPCCEGFEIKRCIRPVEDSDRSCNPIERLGWNTKKEEEHE